MGCWNGTCGISQIAIRAGEPVKAVIIMNKAQFPGASGFCYQSDYADPISFVIEGQYNDYGSMENIKNTKSMRLFKEYFNEGIQNETIKVKADGYYDNEMFGNSPDRVINYTKVSNEQLIDLLERDRVQMKSSYFSWDRETERGKTVPVWSSIGLMMTHTTVFNSVRDSLYYSGDYDYRDFSDKKIKQDCLYAVEDLFENNKIDPEDQEELDELGEKIKAAKEANDHELEEKLINRFVRLTRLSMSMDRSWDNDKIRKTTEWSNKVRIFKSGEGSDMKAFKKYYDMLAKDFNKEEKQEIINMLAEMIVLMNIMVALRKPWMAQSGKGSQSFDKEAYVGLSKGIMKVIYAGREDIKDYELYCTKTWVQPSSGATFECDEAYMCTAVDYERDLIWIKVSEDQTTTINYSEFLKYFEY